MRARARAAALLIAIVSGLVPSPAMAVANGSDSNAIVSTIPSTSAALSKLATTPARSTVPTLAQFDPKARAAAARRADRARALVALRRVQVPATGKISERFGARGKWTTRHTGIDIDARFGASVHAVVAGTVVKSVFDRFYGNLLVVRGHGVDIWYAHMSKRIPKVGQHVGRGQVIGHVGCTGRCFGPHLHLEVRKDDKPTDPATFLWGDHRGVAGKVPAWVGYGIMPLAKA